MIQTVNSTHEVFGRDNVIEVAAEVFQGDVGSVEIRTSFTQGDAPLDLSGWTVSVTNRAPNGEMVMLVGGTEAPLVVDGATVTWTLQPFDTAQAGTYTAQMRVATADQTITVVFFRYNVERSLAGDVSHIPVQYTTLSALVSEIQGMRDELADMNAQVDQMRELYELFMTIIQDGGVVWDTLVGKPDTFPPSPHIHEQFATYEEKLSQLDKNQQGMVVRLADKLVTIAVEDWTYNAEKMRYETVIEDDALQADMIVILQVPDEDNGTYDLSMLKPRNGSVSVCTHMLLNREISLDMTLYKVFESGVTT